MAPAFNKVSAAKHDGGHREENKISRFGNGAAF